MSITLNRKRVSALAKLDFSNKSHCQRMDMIASALGARNQASLMAMLKSLESDAPPLPGVADEPVFLRRFLSMERVNSSDKPYYLLKMREDVVGPNGWTGVSSQSAVSERGGEFLLSSGIGAFLEREDGSLEATERRDDHALTLSPAEQGYHLLMSDGRALCRISQRDASKFMEISGVQISPEPVVEPSSGPA